MVDTISFRCESCEAHLQAPGDAQARSTICTSCGAKVKVPVMMEGPAIQYDDAPAAPEIFKAPTVRIGPAPRPDPRHKMITLGVAAAGVVLAIGAIAFIATRNSTPPGPTPEEIAETQARAKAQEERQARAKAQEEARAKAATEEANRKAAIEMQRLEAEKARMKRELDAQAAALAAEKAAAEKRVADRLAAEKAAVEKLAAEEARRKAALPSYDQLQKDLKRSNAEYLLARQKLTRTQEEQAITKTRLTTGQSEIERAEATLLAQENTNSRIRNSPGYSDAQIAAATRIEDQLQTKINRLREEQDKRTARLIEIENQLPGIENEVRLAGERLNTTKEMLKQVPAPTTELATTPAK